MSIEILTVSLSDESIDRIVTALHARMQHPQVTITQSNPPSAQNPQSAESPGFQQEADPWQNGGVPQTAPPQPQPSYQPPAQVQPQQAPGTTPVCAHGPKKWVPPGFSQTTQKSYQGFWACPAPRGQQCPRS